MITARTFGAAVVLGAALMLTACSSGDVEVHLDGAGPFELEVGPCVNLATSSDLRDDQGPVNRVTVYVTSAAQRVDGDIYYDVTGETEVRTGGMDTYSWSCVIHSEASGKKLDAELTSFAPKAD